MKKLILLLAFAVASVVAFAQQNATFYAHTVDTLTGADTGLYQYPVKINMPFGYSIEQLQAAISGTSETDSSYLQYSVDGVNWYGSTLYYGLSNSAGSKTTAVVTPVTAQYIRLKVLQTGTTEANKQTITWGIYPAKNQFGSGPPMYTLTSGDTLTNTETGSYALPTQLNGVYAYSVQVVDDELSGSATNTVTLQTSNDNTNWTTLQTNAFTADGNIVWQSATGDLGRYVRVYGSNSGTGVHYVKAYIKLYPRIY